MLSEYDYLYLGIKHSVRLGSSSLTLYLHTSSRTGLGTDQGSVSSLTISVVQETTTETSDIINHDDDDQKVIMIRLC